MWMTTHSFFRFRSRKRNDVISAVNEDLKEISTWCCRKSLLINPDKTKLICEGVPPLMRTLPTPLPSATMLGTLLDVECFKAYQETFSCHGHRSEGYWHHHRQAWYYFHWFLDGLFLCVWLHTCLFPTPDQYL